MVNTMGCQAGCWERKRRRKSRSRLVDFFQLFHRDCRAWVGWPSVSHDASVSVGAAVLVFVYYLHQQK